MVEDDESIVNIIVFNLENAGFKVKALPFGAGIFHEIRNFKPDIVLLDIMLPDVDGFEILHALRQKEDTQHIPVIMVTAKDAQDHRIQGLEYGADDYVVKPFSPRELVLRIEAVLRRSSDSMSARDSQYDTINKGALKIDKARYEAFLNDRPLDLTRIEFKLLCFLAEHPSIVYTREMLLDKVWGYDYPVNSRTVDTHIRRLRMKLGPECDLIETIRGIGYRFKD